MGCRSSKNNGGNECNSSLQTDVFDIIVSIHKPLLDNYANPNLSHYCTATTFDKKFEELKQILKKHAHKMTQVLPHGVNINYKLQFCGQSTPKNTYLIAAFTGFNNLNLQKVVNIKQDKSDRCTIKSQEFWIQFGYLHRGSTFTRLETDTNTESFEKDCDFLSKENFNKINNSKKPLKLIDLAKIKSLLGPCDFDTLSDQHQEIILGYFREEWCKNLIRAKAQRLTTGHDNKRNQTDSDVVDLDALEQQRLQILKRFKTFINISQNVLKSHIDLWFNFFGHITACISQEKFLTNYHLMFL